MLFRTDVHLRGHIGFPDSHPRRQQVAASQHQHRTFTCHGRKGKGKGRQARIENYSRTRTAVQLGQSCTRELPAPAPAGHGWCCVVAWDHQQGPTDGHRPLPSPRAPLRLCRSRPSGRQQASVRRLLRLLRVPPTTAHVRRPGRGVPHPSPTNNQRDQSLGNAYYRPTRWQPPQTPSRYGTASSRRSFHDSHHRPTRPSCR